MKKKMPGILQVESSEEIKLENQEKNWVTKSTLFGMKNLIKLGTFF
jgi:hypothetical protein